jgi:SHS2 domain-containing protein
MTRQGHRTVPHTADLRIEAWAASREECVAEAVRGLAGSFAELPPTGPRRTEERRLPPAADPDLLVAALDEVVYLLDAAGEIPASVTIAPAPDGGLIMALSLAPAGDAELVGAVPKAVSWHELRFSADAAGRWSASVTVDV